MTGRSIWVGLILATLTPTIARSQGLEIDHKAVGCIVVGKYPKMNACFTPAASLAQSRVYFRPEGTPSWYYVNMKSDQPCLSGTLPKPSKKLVGKKVEYYLEAQNKTFVPSRTAEYAPIVVRSAQECKKNVPIAPFLNNATVAVFPSVPAGFVGGGIGTAAVVGIVGAGAAAVGTTAVVVSNNNDDNTTTTIASSGNPTTTVVTVTTTLPITTTTLAKVNHAPFAVLKTNPDPPQGTGPLTVTFNMCASSDPDGDPLSFFFEFGDGNTSSGSCVDTHTYSAAFREAAAGNVKSLDSTYTFQGSVVDPGTLSATKSRTVVATKPAPPTCGTPSVAIASPANGTCQVAIGGAGGTTPVPVNVTATDSQGISNVIVKGVNNFDYVGTCSFAVSGPSDQKTATGSEPNFSATLALANPTPASFPHCYQIGASATNSCGNAASSSIQFILASSSCYPFIAARDVKESLAWSSDLDVEGGQLQVIVNGSTASYPDAGRAYGMAALVDGPNHVEATLVEGKGKAGLWRFEFLSSQTIASGSIRVLAGDAVTVAASAVTFRLRGTPGERIAFTFDKR
jgi:PKD domain-containing protein